MKRQTFTILMLLLTMAAQAVIKLPLTTSGYNQMTLQYDATTGEYSITTTGSDPYAYTIALPRNIESGETYFYFEYKSDRVLTNFQVYFGNAWAEANSKVLGSLAKTAEWKSMEFNLASSITQCGWGKTGQKLRIDPGMASGAQIMIRNICIRKKGESTEDAASKHERQLREYLHANYPCYIDNVTVDNTNVTISGAVPADEGEYSLVELPLYAQITDDNTYIYKAPLEYTDEGGKYLRTFSMKETRNKMTNSIRRDRALSKWAIVQTINDKDSIMSHAHYADSIRPKRNATLMPLKGKKGLGGFIINGNLSDLDDLGIKSVTVNMLLNNLISDKASFGNSTSYTFSGKTYYINKGEIDYFDRVFKECQKRGIVTSAILLIQPIKGNILTHPDNDGGYYSMPNLTDQTAINVYQAIITYLADRYSQNANGRINHWIMHNEVDYGNTWTNMGSNVPMLTYLDTYVKSMRLVYNVVRQYDQHASVLGSYTHSWNSTSSDGIGYSSHNMLDHTVLFSKAEGDFRWGVAYHPYPQSLLQPRFWTYDTQATYDINSQYCTFKNLEVINLWILSKENIYKDGTKRLLFLSENGTNSPDYTTAQLKYQAAGACWAWKKVKELDGIDGIQWHNWQDNREEFGLCIGLRRYPDDESDPNGCKPVWYVWQAAETENEDDVFAPYLTTIGKKSWDDIFNQKLIADGIDAPTAETSDRTGIYDLQGRAVSHPTKGIYINNGKKVVINRNAE